MRTQTQFGKCYLGAGGVDSRLQNHSGKMPSLQKFHISEWYSMMSWLNEVPDSQSWWLINNGRSYIR